MEPQWWHLCLSGHGRKTLFATEERVRAGVRTVVRVASRDLLLFSLVDEHLHAVVVGERGRAGRLGQRLQLALQALTGVELEPTYIKPVEGRAHLQRLVGYLLGQAPHHRLPVPAALWGGSCFSDLVGARAISALGMPLREALPRLQRADLLVPVGLPPDLTLAPYTSEQVRRAGVARLIASATAATAADPEPTGRSRSVSLVRSTVVQLATAAGIPTCEIAHVLGVGARAVQSRRSRPSSDDAPPPPVLRATLVRLGLEDAVAIADRTRAARPAREAG
mgnify:CR=1 FL=1